MLSNGRFVYAAKGLSWTHVQFGERGKLGRCEQSVAVQKLRMPPHIDEFL